MKCERRDLAIAKLAGGDLPAWQANRLQRHINNCPRCASVLAELSAQRERLLRSPSALDNVSVADATLERLSAEVPRRRGVRIATGAAVLTIAAIGLFARLSVDNAQPSQELPFPSAISIDTQPIESATTKDSNVIIQLQTDNPDVVIYWIGGA